MACVFGGRVMEHVFSVHAAQPKMRKDEKESLLVCCAQEAPTSSRPQHQQPQCVFGLF